MSPLTCSQPCSPQWERRAIGERTRAAMAHLRAQRRRVGEIPYGYRLEPGQVRRVRPTGKREPARLVPDPAEQRVLGLIARLRAQGCSLRAISAALARRGVLARNGRPFAPQTLARLVTRGALSDSHAAGL